LALSRLLFSREQIERVRQIYRVLYRDGLNRVQALEKLSTHAESATDEFQRMLTFAKVGQRALPETFAAMRLTDHAAIYSAATFWWTMGGEGYEPMALGGRRMPSPYLFSAMLSGRFESGCA